MPDLNNSASPFGQAYESLVKLGYHVIPIMPPIADRKEGGKAPATIQQHGWQPLFGWQQYRDTQAEDHDLGYWSTMKGANIGIVLGTEFERDGSVYQLIAVDIDVEDYDEIQELVGALPATPMAKKGHKGVTLFFLAEPEVRSRGYKSSERGLADLLTGNATKQTVVPPSLHKSGVTYRWEGDPVPPEELPILTADDLDAWHETLEGMGWNSGGLITDEHGNRQKMAREDDGFEDGFDRVKEDALRGLELWLYDLEGNGIENLSPSGKGDYRAVPAWRESGSGKDLESRSLSLSIRSSTEDKPGSIMDHGEDKGLSALDLVMACLDLDMGEAKDWLEDRLYEQTAEIIDLQGPAAPEPMTVDDLADEHDVVDDLAEFDGVLEHDPFKEWEDLPPCGLLAMLVEDMERTAATKLRAPAILASIGLMATVTGAQWLTPSRGPTNLYSIFLAPTGSGKSHYVGRAGKILQACGLGILQGPGDFSAITVMEDELKSRPTFLSLQDEIGDRMARIFDPKARASDYGPARMMKELFNTELVDYVPTLMRGRSADPIPDVHFSVLAASTNEKFYGSINSGALEDGFFNRLLVVSTDVKGANGKEAKRAAMLSMMQGTAEDAQPSDLLVEKVLEAHHYRQVGEWQHGDDPAVVATVGIAPLGAETEKQIVPFQEDQMDDLVDLVGSFWAFCESPELCQNTQIGHMFSRTNEIALRIATVVAISRGVAEGVKPVVDLQIMNWAIRFVLWAFKRNAYAAQTLMGGLTEEAKTLQDMLRWIQARPRKLGEITRRFKDIRGGRNAVKQHLETLIEAELILSEEITPEGRGRKTFLFRGKSGVSKGA